MEQGHGLLWQAVVDGEDLDPIPLAAGGAAGLSGSLHTGGAEDAAAAGQEHLLLLLLGGPAATPGEGHHWTDRSEDTDMIRLALEASPVTGHPVQVALARHRQGGFI